MAGQAPALPYLGYAAIPLPPPATLAMPLGMAVRRRVTGRTMSSGPLSIEQVSTLLFHAYGETRDNIDTPFPRPFRTVPSGGALYPLDLIMHSARIEGLAPGFHYYDPTSHSLRLIRRGDLTHKLSACFVQRELALDSSLQLFMTAFFERSTFKYADRGYRFVLIEAGHIAQNLNLAAVAMGLAATCVGGYFDREIDALLELDGVTRSTVYAQVIGAGGPGEVWTDW
jgi:SagB-type dehydrogenase family enzyme